MSRSLRSNLRSKPVTRMGSTHSAGSSSLGRYSTYSTSSTPVLGLHARASSGSGSSSHGASVSSKTNSLGYANGSGNSLALCIPEHDDGVTPTRAAFERSSLGSVNGGTAGDLPHTPSSTASSVSIPFPATPENTEDFPKQHPAYNKDKTLPPLPAPTNGKGKYPSGLSLKSPAKGLQRPRTYSNASSVSTNSVLSVPPSGSTSRGPSPVPDTPRPSNIGGRPSIGGTPRPSISTSSKHSISGGTPRPSPQWRNTETIFGYPATVAVRWPPLTPLSAPSSSNAVTSQGYLPRPLKLVPHSPPLPLASPSPNTFPNLPSDQVQPNQSPEKHLQPGEQPPRPGQVLTYNRNVHDQLKLRAPNGGQGRAHVMPVSPGGTQTLIIPSSKRSSLPSPRGESPKPKPRTGTGMVYRTNLSVGNVAASRMRDAIGDSAVGQAGPVVGC
ncbi:hypothetical protein BU15DRAFT_60412 [Melanogaster broomeanus]|nr:hypothetical protein BU15DRAFT_60412 [Melanogaster broomeanus]